MPEGSGIETVYRPCGCACTGHFGQHVSGRERRRPGPLGSVLRMLDKKGMKEDAGKSMAWASLRCRTWGKPWRHCPAVSGRPWRLPGRNLRHQVRGAR